MAKVKLTSALCRDAVCPPHLRKLVLRCTENTGLGLELRHNGATFWFYYTRSNRKAAQIKIGRRGDISFEEAKRRAKELRSRYVLGEDPAAEKARTKAIILYGELADLHVEHAKGTLRSHANVELAHRVYLKPRFGQKRLSKAAMAVIKELPRYEGCPWLLPNPKTLKPLDNFKRAWASATKAAGLPGLHVHDLRHASIGAMINNGVDLYVAGKIAGHLRPESTARYAFIANSTLAAAVEAGASHMAL